jgi:hypothetical protein
MQACWAVAGGLRMETTAGQALRVVYPGMRIGSAGPDYTGAVVAFDGGELARGDVELHLRADDWGRHGHDRDHAYDRVILHVVCTADAAASTRLANGVQVPVAIFDSDVPASNTALPCSDRHGCSELQARRVLARAGVARLLLRASSCAAALVGVAPWTALARRSARALGYSANADVAERLGGLAVEWPLKELLHERDVDGRSALLLGVAGLLPFQRKCCGLAALDEERGLEPAWRDMDASLPSLDSRLWRLNGLYPNNSPVRRVVALAWLWPRLAQLAAEAPWLVASACEQARAGAASLESWFRIGGDAYWRSHYDYGRRTREADLIGASQARSLVLNALLPWVTARAMLSGDAHGLSMAVRLLASYPPEPESAVTRQFQRQIGLDNRPLTASMQQGMLHLLSHYCGHGLCASCPLVGEALAPPPGAPWVTDNSPSAVAN